MDKAISDEKGMRVPFSDEGSARHFRTRLHTARQIDRSDNAKAYEPGHKMHGHSVYDSLVVKLKHVRGKLYLYLENTAGTIVDAEPLSEIEDGKQGSADGDRGAVEGEGEATEAAPEAEAEVRSTSSLRRV